MGSNGYSDDFPRSVIECLLENQLRARKFAGPMTRWNHDHEVSFG